MGSTLGQSAPAGPSSTPARRWRQHAALRRDHRRQPLRLRRHVVVTGSITGMASAGHGDTAAFFFGTQSHATILIVYDSLFECSDWSDNSNTPTSIQRAAAPIWRSQPGCIHGGGPSAIHPAGSLLAFRFRLPTSDRHSTMKGGWELEVGIQPLSASVRASRSIREFHPAHNCFGHVSLALGHQDKDLRDARRDRV